MENNLAEKKDDEKEVDQKSEISETNGFGKFCWFLVFLVIHAFIGVMIWITFWVVEKEFIFCCIFITTFLVWQTIIHWAAIASSKGFPIFKAIRRMKDLTDKFINGKKPNTGNV